MKKYEIIEHTADIGIKVFGKDLKELFANAAIGMFSIIATRALEHSSTRALKSFEVNKQADGLEDLLVGWLGELLFLFSTKNIVLNRLDIKELDEKHIKSIVSGIDAGNYKLTTEIKAVTYYMLEVIKKNTGWQAQVIFDI